MKKYLNVMAIVLVVSTMLAACSDETSKKEKSIDEDDIPELYRGFKPTDRSKDKGF